MLKTGKELIGYVGVDAGLIWIGDPCYIMGDDSSFRVKSWKEFCETIDRLNHDETKHSEPLGKGIGLLVSSGYGDGQYPVTATFKDGRVQSVTVKFF